MCMTKKIYLALACLMTSLHASASRPMLEIKPGYFFFSNHTLRKIYHGGFEIQASGLYPLQNWIGLYASLGYVHAKGTSLQGNQKTSIWQIPIDLGLRTTAHFNKYIKGYFSIGPRYFHFHQNNDSPYVSPKISKNGAGFFINSGLQIIAHECFILGIFGEYGYEHKSFTSTTPNVYGKPDVPIGGCTFGASVGVAF